MFHRSGYALTDLVLADTHREQIAESLPGVEDTRAGVRNLIAHPTVRRLLADDRLRELLRNVAGADLLPVKVALCD